MRQGFADSVISRLLLLDPPESYSFSEQSASHPIWALVEKLPASDEILSYLIRMTKKQFPMPSVFRFVEMAVSRAALMQLSVRTLFSKGFRQSPPTNHSC
jgi:hypothetical protein